jgi:hypothetical protein
MPHSAYSRVHECLIAAIRIDGLIRRHSRHRVSPGSHRLDFAAPEAAALAQRLGLELAEPTVTDVSAVISKDSSNR